jgi:copper chaperone CopZ
VKQAVERLAGVKGAVVDRTKKEARVTVEDGASPQEMVAAIQGAGKFQAKLVG